MNKDEKIRIGQNILSESDMKLPIKTRLGIITLKVPTLSDKGYIIANTNRALGGVNLQNVMPSQYEFAVACATIEVLMDEDTAPEWWAGIEKMSIEEDWILETYYGYLEQLNKFKTDLKKNRYKGNSQG